MVCHTWSLPEGSYFTGLCSMEMLPETSNPTKSCVLCVVPVQPDPDPVDDPGPVVGPE